MQSILGNTRKPDILFHASGRIDIAAHVARTIGLRQGDVIDIMTDDGECLLYVKHRAPVVGRHEGRAFRTNACGNHFRAWSKTLCKAMLDQCRAAGKARLCVGTPVSLQAYGTAMPIITKNSIP